MQFTPLDAYPAAKMILAQYGEGAVRRVEGAIEKAKGEKDFGKLEVWLEIRRAIRELQPPRLHLVSHTAQGETKWHCDRVVLAQSPAKQPFVSSGDGGEGAKRSRGGRR